MAGEFQESLSPSFSGNGSNENGEFECNICFEVAQDPIVTLCGHLYCWPCLYMWLHSHSKCQECPVCKALIKEEKLVPIYGRGKKSSYPGPWLMPGADLDIPNRPTAQRPETAPAPPPDASYFRQDDFGSPGGFSFISMAVTRYGNFTISSAFGGLIQSLSLHVSGFHDATVYGTTTGFPYWFSSSFHGGHAHGFRLRSNQEQRKTSFLKMSFFVFGFALIIALVLF